jgi:hypothetical protein
MSADPYPISAYIETLGLVYFPRMLSKIRLHATASLHPDFIENMGEGLDKRLCDYLRVSYDDLKAKTLSTTSDDEVLQWAFANGRELNDTDKLMWNHYATKLGWRDQVTASLAKRKLSNGLQDRDDIATMIEYFEYDEGRKS